MADLIQDLIRYVQNGEQVAADVTNRPIQDLASQVNSLRQLLSLLTAGHRIVDEDAILDAATVPGMPVYIDPLTRIYYPALAGSGSTEIGGQALASSYVRGVVESKLTSTTGVVVLYGESQLTTAQLQAVMGGTFTAGQQFLSGAIAGRLTSAPGSLAVFIGTVTSDAKFFIRPQPPQYGHHTHLRAQLVGAPAGTLTDPAFGDPHVITTPSTAVRGWLPANSTYFPGMTPGVEIPAGAVFGYNLLHAAETDLQQIFPPIPFSGATFTQDGLQLDSTKIQVNAFGIWWMTASYGQAPWPTDYAAALSAPVIDMWESRRFGAAADQGVTAIATHPDSLVEFELLNQFGLPASQGSLLLKIATLLTETDAADAQGLAVKSITGAGFTRGPVVTKVKPGAGMVVTGTGNDVDGYSGLVTVASASSATGGAAVVTGSLATVTQLMQDFLVYSLPAGTTSYLIFTIHVPASVLPNSTISAQLLLHSTSAVTTPASLTWAAKALEVPGGGSDLNAASWTSETALAGTVIPAGYVLPLTITVSNVQPQSRVLIRVQRIGSGDGLSTTFSVLGLNYQVA